MQFANDLLKRCWFLAGPTASGKSEVGAILAERISAEIVSMDSMSLYRGMDIGTAKPSLVLRAKIPHHLVDIAEVDQDFSVAEYLVVAERAARDIVERGRVPLFVGGTGLYLRSLLRGVFEGPSADPELRRALEAEAIAGSPEQLHDRLRSVDPVAAGRIHPRDQRRVIRALEVQTQSGAPLSQAQQQPPLPTEDRPANVVWLSPPRDWLYERINRRVEQMFADGLLDEVRGLLNGPRPLGRTASQALGYREAIDHLEGRVSFTEIVTKIQTRTRQFAKRQHTWFRHLEECRAIAMTPDEPSDRLAERIRDAAAL